MPPRGRRGSARATSRSTQPTLAFDSHSNKITKPSTAVSSGPDKLDRKDAVKALESLTPEPPTIIKGEPLSEVELSIRPLEKAQVLAIAPDAVDKEAAKIPEAQIKRYWKAKEDERIAPRVHQKGLSLHDKVLHEFDLSSQYGPCIGINRTKRWKRANKLGLKPPMEVLAVLLKEGSEDPLHAQKAIIDELMQSKFIGE